MRLIEERRGANVTAYVYEPGSYVPLARIDAGGHITEAGGLGTTQDAPMPANDAVQGVAADEAADAQSESGNGGSSNLYYFHTDPVGLPEELTDATGHIRWRAAYKAWGNTLAERWETVDLKGEPLAFGQEDQAALGIEQNLRYQGQYLDRDTGLHYNTFRYYDPDIGRFISPDPIGLSGGNNLYQYAPNPASWIDPWGWCGSESKPTGAKRGPKTDPNAPHNAQIRAEAARLKAEGNENLAGGGGKERAIATPGGYKGSRRPDILYRTPEGEVRAINVGKTKADGTAVTREVKAIADLQDKAGIPTDFVPYDR